MTQEDADRPAVDVMPGDPVDGPLVDFASLEQRADALREAFRSASPFWHVVIDDFLPEPVFAAAHAEFPVLDREQWNSFVHANERKYSNTTHETWGPTLQRLLGDFQSERFVSLLGRLTGIENLNADPELEGGGLHQSVAGGFLNVHADFTVHPRHRHWERRVNLLLYLNETWMPEWGGDLELWSEDMRKREQVIAPLGNRVVIFATGARSYHGHPTPMTCPPDVGRKSLALYYFTEEEAPVARATRYSARPGEGAKAIVIAADSAALRMYAYLKRRLGLSDRSVGRVLRRVDAFRHLGSRRRTSLTRRSRPARAQLDSDGVAGRSGAG